MSENEPICRNCGEPRGAHDTGLRCMKRLSPTSAYAAFVAAGPRLTGSVWVAAKPGEERRYTTGLGWDAAACNALRRDGYRIFRLDFDLPPEFGAADAVIAAAASEVAR